MNIPDIDWEAYSQHAGIVWNALGIAYETIRSDTLAQAYAVAYLALKGEPITAYYKRPIGE